MATSSTSGRTPRAGAQSSNVARPVKTSGEKQPEITESDRIQSERDKNAQGGFFLKSAVWILSRTPFTRNHYQNWTKSRRIIVGWLLWLVTLPIIPIAAIIIWYTHDPEGFKKSPWAKGLIALAVAWAGYAGVVLTNTEQADINGKYSPVQTAPNGETAGQANDTNTASQEAKDKVKSQSSSNASNGRKFDNCTEAFRAGVFDIKRSDPSYQSKLDRDNDGIACER